MFKAAQNCLENPVSIGFVHQMLRRAEDRAKKKKSWAFGPLYVTGLWRLLFRSAHITFGGLPHLDKSRSQSSRCVPWACDSDGCYLGLRRRHLQFAQHALLITRNQPQSRLHQMTPDVQLHFPKLRILYVCIPTPPPLSTPLGVPSLQTLQSNVVDLTTEKNERKISPLNKGGKIIGLQKL